MKQIIHILFMLLSIDKLRFISVAVGFYSWLFCHLTWALFSVEVYYLGWALLTFFVALATVGLQKTNFQSFTLGAFFFVPSTIYLMSCFLIQWFSRLGSIFYFHPSLSPNSGKTFYLQT